MGHLARMCRFHKGKKEEANAVEEDEMLAMLTEILMVDKNEEWWLDFGATCHFTPYKDAFKTMR